MTLANAKDLLETLVRDACKSGADAADAILVDSASVKVGCRMGKVETLERAESGDLGLRVFVGKKQAAVSATERSQDTLHELVERAVAMARLAPEDEYCGLADPASVAKNWPQLDIADSIMPDVEKMIAQAREGEEAAMAVKGVTNSDGGHASASVAEVSFAASNGFSGSYRQTARSLVVTVLAGDATKMERDYYYAARTMAADIPSAAQIGKKAAERVVRKLGSRKMPTSRIPVVFEARVAGGLLNSLASAISGASVARGTSFLKDRLGHKIFSDGVTIVDDPFRARGLRSRPFDAEGILPQKRNIVDRGMLTTWLLDLRSARQLKLSSTGHAARSPGGQPSPLASNLYMEPGTKDVAALIRDIKQGFYVTNLMGFGVNGVTGDYSQAAAGLWIENGEITFPVSEMTIAGNMKDMFLSLTPANDLAFEFGIDSPTLRVEEMTVAGV